MPSSGSWERDSWGPPWKQHKAFQPLSAHSGLCVQEMPGLQGLGTLPACPSPAGSGPSPGVRTACGGHSGDWCDFPTHRHSGHQVGRRAPGTNVKPYHCTPVEWRNSDNPSADEGTNPWGRALVAAGSPARRSCVGGQFGGFLPKRTNLYHLPRRSCWLVRTPRG